MAKVQLSKRAQRARIIKAIEYLKGVRGTRAASTEFNFGNVSTCLIGIFVQYDRFKKPDYYGIEGVLRYYGDECPSIRGPGDDFGMRDLFYDTATSIDDLCESEIMHDPEFWSATLKVAHFLEDNDLSLERGSGAFELRIAQMCDLIGVAYDDHHQTIGPVVDPKNSLLNAERELEEEISKQAEAIKAAEAKVSALKEALDTLNAELRDVKHAQGVISRYSAKK